jgi:hypothetical protein
VTDCFDLQVQDIYGSVIPDAPDAGSHPLTNKLAEEVGKYVEQYLEAMEKVSVNHFFAGWLHVTSIILIPLFVIF